MGCSVSAGEAGYGGSYGEDCKPDAHGLIYVGWGGVVRPKTSQNTLPRTLPRRHSRGRGNPAFVRQ